MADDSPPTSEPTSEPTSQPTPNRTEVSPRMLVFPPVIPITTGILAGLLQWLLPLGWLSRLPLAARLAIGLTVVIAGVLLLACGLGALLRHETVVRPSRPTRFLVKTGVFGLTRNPLYVGGCAVMLGVAMALALDWLVLLLPLSVAVLHVGIIAPEERYLEARFGDDYRRYRARVPRYFGPL